eukprot:SAG31_NODE_1813_length_7211_cov_9.203600_8_plen_75_part_00
MESFTSVVWGRGRDQMTALLLKTPSRAVPKPTTNIPIRRTLINLLFYVKLQTFSHTTKAYTALPLTLESANSIG